MMLSTTSLPVSSSSTDYNAKTAVRALLSAQDYVTKGMASNAKRDLDRAKSYLAKIALSEDSAVIDELQGHMNAIEIAIHQVEQEELLKRIKTQVERQLKYAKEAGDKQNVNDMKRYLDGAKRELSKLPAGDDNATSAVEEFREQYQIQFDELEVQTKAVEERAKSASKIRQFERELRSIRDTFARSGGTMGCEQLEE